MKALTDQSPTRRSLIRAFIAHFAGQGQLSTAYWGFGVGGSVLFAVVLILASLVLMTRSISEEGATIDNPALQSFLSGAVWIFLAYQVLVAVLIWRNAFNVGNRMWGWVARGLVLAGGGGLVFRMTAHAASVS
jgi:hypothetical protein